MFSIFVNHLILFITIQFVLSETTPSQLGSCYLPNSSELEFLLFKKHPQNRSIELGSYVEDSETVHVECKSGKTLKGSPSLLCRNGEWGHDFPVCVNFCDGTLLDRLSLTAICNYDDKFLKCPKKISPGVSIQVKCAFGYSRKPNAPQQIRCLPNGTFDLIPEPCKMNCGRIASDSKVLSKNGIELEVSKAPWHVSVYENNDYICAGSIISPTVAISVAHCFWDEANLILKNLADYQIMAGRSAKNYTTEQSEYSQLLNVQEVYIPKTYQGKDGHQSGDIALLKLEKPLRYSETIAPICLSKELQSNAANYMQSNRNGFIYAFGGKHQLEKVQMKTLSYHECYSKIPNEAKLAEDKFCAYPTDDGFICNGDSGAGFSQVVQDPYTNATYYYIWGVLSHSTNPRQECAGTGDKIYAFTSTFYAPSDFKRKLINVIKGDEALM